MKIQKINILIIIPFFIFCASCYKHNMRACFTMDKDSTVVGDSITFYDCSNYDGRAPAAVWEFGDNLSGRTQNNETLKHAYSQPGIYKIKMWIGGAEIGNKTSDTVVIH